MTLSLKDIEKYAHANLLTRWLPKNSILVNKLRGSETTAGSTLVTDGDTTQWATPGSDGTTTYAQSGTTIGIGSGYPSDTGDQALLNALGWDGACQTYSMANDAGTTLTMVDGTAYFMPIYLPFKKTLTGVMYAQGTQGSFTNDNNNKIALYTSDGTDLTRVATTAANGSSGTLWERTANTVHKEAFSATYTAAAGVYYVAFLANWSAVVTSPTAVIATGRPAAHGTLVLSPSGNRFSWSRTGQTDLGTSFAISAMTTTFDQPLWAALY